MHLHLVEDDDEQCDIRRHFEAAHLFIDDNIKDRNVLVHCQAGISRSATIVISYLMKKLELSAQEANKRVRSLRYQASPNEGFWNSLEDYEQYLKDAIEAKTIKQEKYEKQNKNKRLNNKVQKIEQKPT